jgi:ATP-dependent DNA ligase
VRALAGIEIGRWRLWGRTGTDYTARYPKPTIAQRAGTLVDGERVVLRGGRADFLALLRRHQRQHVIIGYRPGRDGIGRLLGATVQQGELRYVGQLRYGCEHQAGVASGGAAACAAGGVLSGAG